MIRDITIGQYYKADSRLHKLDARVKIIATLLFMIILFIFDRISDYLIATLFLGIVINISKVPFKYMIKGLKSVFMLLLLTVICQLFLTKGGKIVFEYKIIKIYHDGLYNAIMLGMRLILLILGSSMMTFTTTPNQLTDGLESILKPLKIVKIDVHSIAMMMSIALRYIPILIEETDKIMKAQMARGADFESGGFIKRAKNMIPLLIPLFVSAFRRASELALAMEARCYRGGQGRTKMKPLVYTKKDIIAYIYILLFIGMYIILRVLGLEY